MKSIITWIFFLLLIFHLFRPFFCFGYDRPINAKRLVSIVEVIGGGPSMPPVITENSITKQFYYQLDNPELIDSVRVTDECTVTESGFLLSHSITSSTIFYNGVVEFGNGMRTITYITSQGDTLVFIKDSTNRCLEFYSSFDHRLIKEYYAQNGRLDSLKVNQSNANNNNETYIVQRDGYGNVNSIMNDMQVMYIINYPTEFVQNPVQINIDNALQCCYRFDLLSFRMILDSENQIASYNQNIAQYILNTAYHINFDNHGNEHNMIFNMNGDLINYSFDEYDDPSNMFSWGDITYTWESITPNDDPVAPVPSNILHVYPNPFRDNVKIEMQDASISTSEVAIYNIKGQLVKKWEGMKGNEVLWDGKDITNHSISSGVYLVKVKQNGKSLTSKIVKIQ